MKCTSITRCVAPATSTLERLEDLVASKETTVIDLQHAAQIYARARREVDAKYPAFKEITKATLALLKTRRYLDEAGMKKMPVVVAQLGAEAFGLASEVAA